MLSMQKKIEQFLAYNTRRILWSMMATILVTGVVYSIYLGDKIRYDDEREYDRLATHLVQEHIYSFDGVNPSAFRPPGYPFILAGLKWMGLPISTGRILNFLLLAVTVWFVYRILLIKGSPLAASLGAVIVTGYPLFFYAAGTLFPQTIAAFFMMWILYLLLIKEFGFCNQLLLGILLGYSILTIPTFAFFIPVILAWFILRRQFQPLRQALLVILVCCLFVGSWSLRNYLVFNRFVPISANSGLMLLLGNSENTTPNAGPTANICKYRGDEEAKGLDEIDLDHYYSAKAKSWIWDHKLQAFKLYIMKFINNFNYRNNLYTKSEASKMTDLVSLITYLPLLFLFFLRITFYRRWRLSELEKLLIAIYFLSGLVHAIYFPRIRYRLPFDIAMIMICALFISQYLEHKKLIRVKS
jgi:4-amino-4-deoxy-L-arabinose transferase-like glycosyltransferase